MLIVQNDTGNRHSPTVIAAAITSQTGKAKLPTHIELAARQFGLPKDSVILLEQIRTLDKKRLREHMGRVDGPMMHRVDAAIAVSFGLHPDTLVKTSGYGHPGTMFAGNARHARPFVQKTCTYCIIP